MASYWLARGLPLLQEFDNVIPYEFKVNYSQTEEEKEAEAQILLKYKNDQVIDFSVLIKRRI